MIRAYGYAKSVWLCSERMAILKSIYVGGEGGREH